MLSTPFEIYLATIRADYRGGKATEYSYRSALEDFIEAMYHHTVDATSDPKHIECGAPDFIIEKGKVPLGYVETKDIGVNLDVIERSEQMARYLKALNNLILTDYLEFRWYVNGVKRRTVRAAEIGRDGRLAAAANAEANLTQLLRDFYATEAPTVGSPKELAQRLASVTHFIRDQILSALNSGEQSLKKSLENQYKAFKDLLLPALKPEEFADLYAQAITYGLFAAKLSAPEGEKFTLESAYQFLFGNKFLRRLFLDVGEELDDIEIIRPYLQDIVSLLNRADFHAILADFGRRTRTEDPVVHFYETFLAAYDPKLRESRGVYYTPEPVVQFIVRAVDELLKTRFDKPWGLADPSVKVLDPAAGTGTFLYYVIRQIHEEVVLNRGQAGLWPQCSKELLNRIFGFELLIAPYVVSHLKLGLELKELGAPLEGRDERLRIFLTNSLEEGISRAEQLAGLGSYIAEESSDAAEVKKRGDIMVVLGNPPYSGHSANASVGPDGKPNFIGKLVREYYFVDGAPLGERNPKWLQDDYVKFIRFGEWRINKTGHGILAFITNHGYLDNPTFRGMRQHLMQTFDEIYILNLHGNSKKKEVAPDGSKDENVFDIQQGVAILIAIKNPSQKKSGLKNSSQPSTSIHYADLWGERTRKYEHLLLVNIEDISWQEVSPNKPLYLFIPKNQDLQSEYVQYWHLMDLMPASSVGIVTARDGLTIHWKSKDVLPLVKEFTSLSVEEARARFNLGVDVRDWKVELAQRDLLNTEITENKVIPISYRPFDIRYTYYTGTSRGFMCRPRPEINKHIIQKNNLILGIGRQGQAVSQEGWDIVSCYNTIVDFNAFRRGGVQTFPLYLFGSEETLFDPNDKEANLSPAFIKEFSQKLGLKYIPDGQGDGQTTFGPEDIFYYAYAVLHSPTYRSRYAEFLKIDFPRLPLTSDPKLFFALAGLGQQLAALHLLKTPRVDHFITTYPISGSNRVEKVSYASGNVWINAQQYFGGVPEAVWNFKIGGYQVCEKWLKDRKGRVLSGEDITHYQRVVVALSETIRLMQEIDRTIPGWPME